MVIRGNLTIITIFRNIAFGLSQKLKKDTVH